jgi:predicted membrane channel-forming protein YqfA (hemolysin III family)
VRLLTDHFLLLVWLAALLSAFLALLWRDEPRARQSFFVRTFLALTGGSVVVSWLLAAVPR